MSYANQLIDKRVIDRNIAKGLVDPDEFARQLESLPDAEPNAVRVDLEGSLDDDEADAPFDDEPSDLASDADVPEL